MGKRVEDGQPRELVPEADEVGLYLEQAARAGLVGRRLPRAEHCFDQPDLRPAG